jgi:hypothetical protein
VVALLAVAVFEPPVSLALEPPLAPAQPPETAIVLPARVVPPQVAVVLLALVSLAPAAKLGVAAMLARASVSRIAKVGLVSAPKIAKVGRARQAQATAERIPAPSRVPPVRRVARHRTNRVVR